APAAISIAVVVALVASSSLDSRIARIDEASAAVPSQAVGSVQIATTVPRTKVLPSVANAVRQALSGASLPSGLNPPLDRLADDGYQLPPGCAPTLQDPSTQTLCHLGDATSTNKLVVFGDSHIEMWMPAILPMAQADAWDVIPLARKGCVVPAWIGSGYP